MSIFAVANLNSSAAAGHACQISIARKYVKKVSSVHIGDKTWLSPSIERSGHDSTR